MKYLSLILMLLIFGASAICNPAQASNANYELKTERDSVGYAYGMLMYNYYHSQG
jgi:hypothetical protein